jgi:hypothetical protein
VHIDECLQDSSFSNDELLQLLRQFRVAARARFQTMQGSPTRLSEEQLINEDKKSWQKYAKETSSLVPYRRLPLSRCNAACATNQQIALRKVIDRQILGK